ncbi:adenylosuccinate synthase [Thermoplasmatales archaeon AK]|nr:adenylosuccinate synthase [Thermoplasmatales archaeon AK]
MIAAVLGLQFGDEGKGKITDFLSDKFNVVVRFNGGGNAGHTVVAQGKTYKFHLVPSGSLRSEVVILGNGMVIDPFALNQEIESLRASGCSSKILISKMAHVVTPMHKILDIREESVRSKMNIGTTAQGIGPTYEDKYARTGIRMVDLLDYELLRDKIEIIYRMKENLLKDSEFSDVLKREEMTRSLHGEGLKLADFLKYTEIELYELYAAGKSILFEGAQGTMLDIDFGMYPFVTSSNALSGALMMGSGFTFRKVHRVIGVVKAYMSRVGSGPFPTELTGDDGKRLRDLGNEYGTTTGRPRRVGWLDLPMLRYTIRMNDVDVLALTRLDTLGLMPEIKVGLRYLKDGREISYVPRSYQELAGVKIDYISMKPWGRIDPDEVGNDYEALPKEARDYVALIERELKKTVGIISLGEKRENTILRGDLKISLEELQAKT